MDGSDKTVTANSSIISSTSKKQMLTVYILVLIYINLFTFL